jgi:uracil-DNA glycosylase
MRRRIEAIVDELKRLKRSGVQAASVSPEAIQALRLAALGSRSATVPAVSVPVTARAPSAPPPESSAKRGASAPDLTELIKAVESSKPAARAGSATVKRATPSSGALPPPPQFDLPAGDKQRQMSWLRERVLNCPECRRHLRPECQVVFGVGSLDAKIFFCGEAPGAEEEQCGEPFVGPAGELLTKMIQAMGVKREDVYIGNIMNWRPELDSTVGNRPPTAEEMAFCLPYLQAQVRIVQPEAIVALGATAVTGLLGPGAFKTMGEIRGQWREFKGIPVLATYHPSYLLRNASLKQKRVVWEDLLQVMERVGMPISDAQRRFFLNKL